ncbi:MAG TPA: hypothetical protein VGX78_00190 [Pirellulales bacterium]|nr:hypothetical protein [Pirellulales bacterium]
MPTPPAPTVAPPAVVPPPLPPPIVTVLPPLVVKVFDWNPWPPAGNCEALDRVPAEAERAPALLPPDGIPRKLLSWPCVGRWAVRDEALPPRADATEPRAAVLPDRVDADGARAGRDAAPAARGAGDRDRAAAVGAARLIDGLRPAAALGILAAGARAPPPENPPPPRPPPPPPPPRPPRASDSLDEQAVNAATAIAT